MPKKHQQIVKIVFTLGEPYASRYKDLLELKSSHIDLEEFNKLVFETGLAFLLDLHKSINAE